MRAHQDQYPIHPRATDTPVNKDARTNPASEPLARDVSVEPGNPLDAAASVLVTVTTAVPELAGAADMVLEGGMAETEAGGAEGAAGVADAAGAARVVYARR